MVATAMTGDGAATPRLSRRLQWRCEPCFSQPFYVSSSGSVHHLQSPSLTSSRPLRYTTGAVRQHRRANAAAAPQRIARRRDRRFDSTFTSASRLGAYRDQPVTGLTFPPGLLHDRLQRDRCNDCRQFMAHGLAPHARWLGGSGWRCSDDMSICCGA